MTDLEWVRIIILVIAIVFSISVFVFTLAKARKEGFTNRRVSFLVASLGVLFLAYLSFNVRQIEPADGVQIMLMLGLVTVTGIYAYSTGKMAEEMKEQRYDAVRPILDIADIEQTPFELASQAYEKKPPNELECKLRNVGVGPAIDVYSFVQSNAGEHQRYDFGTIAIGKETGSERLSLEQKDGRWFLVAYYKDVYGRCFKSSREVVGGVVNPNPLEISIIAEGELPK